MFAGYDPEKHFEIIEDQPQYFLDDTILEWVKNIKRTHHIAAKHESNPVIRRDQPWEVWPHLNTTVTLLREEDGRFRCWYLDFTNLSFEGGGAEASYNPQLSYAESTDGVRWDKPALGMVQADGIDTNRLDWEGAPGQPVALSVIRDPVDPDPQRRYKMAYLPEGHNINVPKRTTVGHSHSLGLCLAYSADGLRWQHEPANPVSRIWGSDVLTLIYDDELERYVIYGRVHYAAESGNPAGDQWFTRYYPAQPNGWIPKRAIYRIESEDLLNWTEPKRVLAPGSFHNLDDQFYSMAYFRMGRYHCGLMPVFHTVDNTKDVELVYSHDGFEWHHFANGPWVIPRGGEGTWDEFQADTVIPPLKVGDQHFVFYAGADFHHDWPHVGKLQGLDTPEADYTFDQINEGLGLAMFRADGFVSLDAGLREGIVNTKPFFARGEKLIINARCEKNGYIEVEMADIMDEAWEGFTHTDCDRFTGDDTAHVVSWQGQSRVNLVLGYTRVRFYMKNAELYSFRVADQV